MLASNSLQRLRCWRKSYRISLCSWQQLAPSELRAASKAARATPLCRSGRRSCDATRPICANQNIATITTITATTTNYKTLCTHFATLCKHITLRRELNSLRAIVLRTKPSLYRTTNAFARVAVRSARTMRESYARLARHGHSICVRVRVRAIELPSERASKQTSPTGNERASARLLPNR